MAIPEAQLETWSHQGSVTQSSSTYNTIKRVVEETGAPYAGKDFKVFLQGSYGNDTNIYAESDVDTVIVLNDCWQSDLTTQDGLGYTDMKSWEATHKFMRDSGLLKADVDLSKAFTNEFIK